MQLAKTSFFLVLVALLSLASTYNIRDSENSLIRLIRAAGTKKQECRYEKEAWEECDSTTGLQRRALKLKSGTRPTGIQCEEVKYISRPCKKACKYLKGTWTDCVNGMRSRVDQLRNTGSGCEETRSVTRKCKSVCRYSKSEWSPCESGVKTKTLTMTEGDGECEKTKVITKQCSDQAKQRPSKQGKQRGRKNQPKSNVEDAA